MSLIETAVSGPLNVGPSVDRALRASVYAPETRRLRKSQETGGVSVSVFSQPFRQFVLLHPASPKNAVACQQFLHRSYRIPDVLLVAHLSVLPIKHTGAGPTSAINRHLCAGKKWSLMPMCQTRRPCIVAPSPALSLDVAASRSDEEKGCCD